MKKLYEAFFVAADAADAVAIAAAATASLVHLNRGGFFWDLESFSVHVCRAWLGRELDSGWQ